MHHKWLRKWDEKRATLSDAVKAPSAYVLDSNLSFPLQTAAHTIEEFCNLAEKSLKDPHFYSQLIPVLSEFHKDGCWLTYPSSIATDVDNNNTVWVKTTEGRGNKKAVVIFHHWNATSRLGKLSWLFSKFGVDVFEIALPYHFERNRSGSTHAEYMLSPNLGRTIQSVKQGVLDGLKLIYWLNEVGYKDISVLGMSLGSWIAGLVAAHDEKIRKASLLLTSGSLADMVWTGRATRHIRASIETDITQSTLNKAWEPISLGNYIKQLSRPNLKLQIVLARQDTVVLPKLSDLFIQKLKHAGADVNQLMLNCGHYSISKLPYSILLAKNLINFQNQKN